MRMDTYCKSIFSLQYGYKSWLGGAFCSKIIQVDASLSDWSYISFCAVTNFYFSLSLPATIVLCLPPLPQLDPFLLLCASLLFSLCYRGQRGHQTIAAMEPPCTSCAEWHGGDGGLHVVPVVRCCRPQLGWTDKHSSKWISCLRRRVSPRPPHQFRLMHSRWR